MLFWLILIIPVWIGIYIDLHDAIVKKEVAPANWLFNVLLFVVSPIILIVTLTMGLIHKIETFLHK